LDIEAWSFRAFARPPADFTSPVPSAILAPTNTTAIPRGMSFAIGGQIKGTETIACGHGIRELKRLNKVCGPARWRKLQGHVNVRVPGGSLRPAEAHWYE
jgi:hypothetical protein